MSKELADVLYVVYGTIVAYGLQEVFPEIFTAVHKSIMSKISQMGEVQLSKDGGKILKSLHYKKPDIKKILQEHKK